MKKSLAKHTRVITACGTSNNIIDANDDGKIFPEEEFVEMMLFVYEQVLTCSKGKRML